MHISRFRTMLGALCVAATLAVSASSASASTNYSYCGVWVGVDAWCSSGSVRSVIYNKGMIATGYRVGIRQDINGGPIVNRKFGTTTVATNSQAYFSTAKVANASSSARVVVGALTDCPECVHPAIASGGSSPTTAAATAFQLNTATGPGTNELPTANIAAIMKDGSAIASRVGPSGTCIGRTSGTDYTESCSPRVSDFGASSVVTEDLTVDLRPGTSRVFGIAPPGANEVLVSLGARRATATPVVDGVFVAVVAGPASALPRVVLAN